MTEHHFDTPHPLELHVELGAGTLQASATDTTESSVEITGEAAEEVVVRLEGDRLSVVAPRRRGLRGDPHLDVVVRVPAHSSLSVRTGSAEVTTQGVFTTARVKAGSGDVHLDVLSGQVVVDTGSGDVEIRRADAEVRVKSGSGRVAVEEAAGSTVVSTGSGDVHLGTARATTVVKTGSGDLEVGASEADLSLSSASGDVVVRSAVRGRVTTQGASGDVRIGVPAGTPVWTDVSTVSGRIRSTLEGTGAPQEGQDHVELRASTVSGDVVLAPA